MRAIEFILEGGWLDLRTQSTHITPYIVENVVKFLKKFEILFNKYLTDKLGLLPIEVGNPCGSTTYYKKDLIHDPNKEYGDIDVNFHLPAEIPFVKAVSIYKNAIKSFCKDQLDIDSETGGNLIAKINNQWIQIDLIMSGSNNKEWVKLLASEWKIKGVLSGSLFSSLAQVLNLSFGGTGIQAKLLNGKLVPFRISKNTQIINISNNPLAWAFDIAKFFGATKFSKLLIENPGLKDDQHIEDIIKSIKGLAITLEDSGKLSKTADNLLKEISLVYLKKIDAVINSSKFDKAESIEAKEKAMKTKQILANKSEEYANALIALN